VSVIQYVHGLQAVRSSSYSADPLAYVKKTEPIKKPFHVNVGVGRINLEMVPYPVGAGSRPAQKFHHPAHLNHTSRTQSFNNLTEKPQLL